MDRIPFSLFEVRQNVRNQRIPYLAVLRISGNSNFQERHDTVNIPQNLRSQDEQLDPLSIISVYDAEELPGCFISDSLYT